MENEDAIIRLAQSLQALQARVEISDSVLAALIATHPDPGAVLREWQPIVAAAATTQALAVAAGQEYPNDLMDAAVKDHVQRWTDVLRGLAQNGPPLAG